MSHEIIRREEDGKLVAAGYQWGEENVFIFFLSGTLMLVIVVAAVVSFYAMKTHPFSGLLLLGISVLIGYGANKLFEVRFRPRSLIFELDGTMRMPQGVPGFWSARVIDGHHGNIGTVEKIRDEERFHDGTSRVVHRVAIFGKEGHIVRISKPLHPDDAHLVAVQLTAALQAIRDEIAWRARGQEAR